MVCAGKDRRYPPDIEANDPLEYIKVRWLLSFRASARIAKATVLGLECSLRINSQIILLQAYGIVNGFAFVDRRNTFSNGIQVILHRSCVL